MQEKTLGLINCHSPSLLKLLKKDNSLAIYQKISIQQRHGRTRLKLALHQTVTKLFSLLNVLFNWRIGPRYQQTLANTP